MPRRAAARGGGRRAPTDGLTRAGLLPSLSHDRVRNVLASPLAGLDGGPDLIGIVRALDAALCARPRLAELPGRFLRIADLPGGPDWVRAAVVARLGLAEVAWERSTVTAARPVGLVRWRETAAGRESGGSVLNNSGGAAVLLAPLGRLTSAQLTWGADRVAGRAARITPWRSVVLPDLPDAAGVLREAAELGFGVDDASPWLRVTSCAGRPGCDRASPAGTGMG